MKTVPESLTFRIFLLVVVAYVLIGLVGHDPWKQDETYIFGAIQEFLESGNWLIPRVAGEPFMEKPPLYHWVASAMAYSFRPMLPLHDGARLASGIFVAVTCLAIGWTARHLWGAGTGRYAVLTMLANLGTALYAHIMITDLTVMAGAAVACGGIIFITNAPVRAGLLIGSGIGIGFLGKGLFLPGVAVLTAIALPILFAQWRNQKFIICIGAAIFASLPWVGMWPIALYLKDPKLFQEWFWVNNVGRFLGFSVEILGAENSNGYWLRTLAWFAFPAFPLACFALLRNWIAIKTKGEVQFLVVFSSIMLLTLFTSASARESYALPVLVPLSLLAAHVTQRLPTIIDVAWDWICRIGFWAVAFVIWGAWLTIWAGYQVPWNKFNELLPTADVPITSAAPLAALALTFSVAILTFRLQYWRGRGLISWVLGLQLCVGLLLTLWMPWLDAAKSYRGVFLSMQKVLPLNPTCVESVSLGESERAMLRYVVGINTQRHETVRNPHCRFFLLEGLAQFPPAEEDFSDWTLLWTGSRPKDTREQFWLFRRRSVDPE